MKKNITRIAQMAVLSGLVSITGIGSALAADTANLGTTGPSSVNDINISNSNTIVETNSNNVSIVNFSSQSATTGDSSVSGNTNAGSASTGAASNYASTQTVVAISNGQGYALPGGSFGGGSGAGLGSGSGAGSGSPVVYGGRGGGSGQFAFGGSGAGSLPVTGPKDIVDVSALRALYKPMSGVTPLGGPALVQVKHVSTSLLLGALLLTVIGTVGSVMYVGKRSERV